MFINNWQIPILFLSIYYVTNLVAQPYANYQCYSSDPNKWYEFSPLINNSWDQLSSVGKAMWSSRNGHATAVFKGAIWLVGGRSDSHALYNLEYSVVNADVWYSIDADQWTQVTQLRGDFYAQNDDAKQPGPTAPWYGRYGHTLTTLPMEGKVVMILLGGFAPDVVNDVWVTEDGTEWAFAQYAPWTARAYHTATVFQKTLYVMGGTPLNNDVWFIKHIKRVDRLVPPLTRAMYVFIAIPRYIELINLCRYLNYTYEIVWEQLPQPPWSPRAGHGAVSHWHPPIGFRRSSFKERLLVVGGYGGWLKGSGLYDGLRCRADVWEYSLNVSGNASASDASLLTYGNYSWKLLTEAAEFGGRAWFGLTVWHGNTPWTEVTGSARAHGYPPRIWLVGGGYIGSDGPHKGSREVRAVEGRADSYWSRDGIHWNRTNTQYGGDGQSRKLWSSSDWSCFKTSSSFVVFRGVWGHTLAVFNSSTRTENAGDLYFFGGVSDTTSGGTLNRIWRASFHLLCFVNGVECSGIGMCQEGYGCTKCAGGDDYCYTGAGASTISGSYRNAFMSAAMWIVIVGFVVHLLPPWSCC